MHLRAGATAIIDQGDGRVGDASPQPAKLHEHLHLDLVALRPQSQGAQAFGADQPEAALAVENRPADQPRGHAAADRVREVPRSRHPRAVESARADHQVGAAGTGLGDQRRDVFRAVLAVAVHKKDVGEVARDDLVQRVADRNALPPIRLEPQAYRPGLGGPLARAVGRAVVDDDHLGHLAADRSHQAADDVGLVVGGNQRADPHRLPGWFGGAGHQIVTNAYPRARSASITSGSAASIAAAPGPERSCMSTIAPGRTCSRIRRRSASGVSSPCRRSGAARARTRALGAVERQLQDRVAKANRRAEVPWPDCRWRGRWRPVFARSPRAAGAARGSRRAAGASRCGSRSRGPRPHATRERRVLFDLPADHEERGGGVLLAQDVEHSGRDLGRGTVVERQRHAWLAAAGHVGPAVQQPAVAGIEQDHHHHGGARRVEHRGRVRAAGD